MRLTLLVLLVPVAADAGGLARPNGISARGTGMGGAWSAWVDDPTALWFNPAALSEIEPQLQLGGELVLGPRTYTPVASDGTRGPDQSTTVVAPLPTGGVVGRFSDDDAPSRFTLAAGAWSPYGGQVRFDKTGMPALDATREAAFEATAGAALRISDRLSLGAALRFGLGLFSLEATQLPFDAEMSATGVGVGLALGLALRPTPALRLSASWRSPLRISTSGSATLALPGGTMREDIEHDQLWPQQASLGLGFTPNASRTRLAAQLDWTQWSAVRDLVVVFPANPTLDQTFREDWRDSWALRAGIDHALSRTLSLRGGAYVDTAAVPDRTLERRYLDAHKLGLATGASLSTASWRFDAALDLVLAPTRSVPDNTAATTSFPADRNRAPGDYAGTLLTFELAAAYRF